jgi:ribosomal protein S18 acetylase RimI-like enzyme
VQSVFIHPYSSQNFVDVMQLIKLLTPHYFAPKETSDFEYYLKHEIEQYFVIEVNQHIVGCGGINFENNFTTAKISWDLIHPDYQGKGYGRLLLEHRLQILHAMPTVKRIIVRTSQHAFRFYEKSGFVVQEVHPNFWAEGYDMYMMEFPIR